MSQVKVFVTDRETDRLTEGQMRFNVPCFRERRGTTRGTATLSVATPRTKTFAYDLDL